METEIIAIGNSRGVRLPKALLEASGLARVRRVELAIRPEGLLIRPAQGARSGWTEAFAGVIDRGEPLIPDGLANAWDDKDWKW